MIIVADTLENNLNVSINYHRIAPRDTLQPMACYHTLKICLISQGRAIWSIGSKKYSISKGDIVILNNSEFRALHTVFPPNDLEMLSVDFEPRIIWTHQNEVIKTKFMKVFFDRGSDFENRIEAENSVSPEIEGLLWQIAAELRNKKPDYNLMVQLKLLNILVCLNRLYCDNSEVNNRIPKFSKPYFKEMNSILNYIDTHLMDNITLEIIAKMIHMHPAYFSRLFKKYNGLGLSQYINKRRIQKAIQYLSDENLSIIEIANLCGYNSASNFYKAFKSVTGKIPKEYRT